MRIQKEDYFLNIAKVVASRSTCLRAQCGAVIVKNGVIISTGYNGSVRGQENCCDRGTCPREKSEPNTDKYLCVACHAEINAIVNIARNGGGGIVDSTLFVHFTRLDDKLNSYNKPCEDCMKAIINSGIKFIINYTEDKEKISLDVSEIENGKVITQNVFKTLKMSLS